mgnify:CR=1 FL=1
MTVAAGTIEVMVERIPGGVPIHSWVDRLIREAEERGEFDNLRGAGKPLPGIDKPWDEDWWIKQKIREEEVPPDVLLPPALQLRREVAALPETVRDLPDEETVRAWVSEVNERVAQWIRAPSGPVLPVAPAPVEKIVAQWRAERANVRPPHVEPGAPDTTSPVSGRPSEAPRGSEPRTEPAAGPANAETSAPARVRWWQFWRRRNTGKPAGGNT